MQLYIGIARDPTLQKVKWVVSECSLQGAIPTSNKIFSAPLPSDRPPFLGAGVADKPLALGLLRNAEQMN